MALGLGVEYSTSVAEEYSMPGTGAPQVWGSWSDGRRDRMEKGTGHAKGGKRVFFVQRGLLEVKRDVEVTKPSMQPSFPINDLSSEKKSGLASPPLCIYLSCHFLGRPGPALAHALLRLHGRVIVHPTPHGCQK